MRSGNRSVAVLTAAVLVLAACSGDDGASRDADEPDGDEVPTEPTRGDAVAVPAVEGPITGGERDGLPSNPAPRDILDEYDYVEEEFFFSGDATAYQPIGELSEDGAWTVEDGETAPFASRLLVRRPADPADASGVIAVEWFNVSGGQDADPDFGFTYPELLSTGTTWVGVSAQFNGVAGTGIGIVEGLVAEPLHAADPTRYDDLDHPGDDFSYDIYSQAAQALRRPDGPDPLGGVRADHVISIGESQSAARLTTYINAVHPVADIFDGFLVHSRSATATPLAEGVEAPEVVTYRTDLDEPILFFQAETDVARGFPARQPDTEHLVTWEVAGAAHADQSQLDYGGASARELDPDRELPDFRGPVWGDAEPGATTARPPAGVAGPGRVGA